MDEIKINIGGVDVNVKKEDVSKAIEAGELKIETDLLIPKSSEDYIIYSKEEHETFKKNISDEEYKKGKAAGNEMPIKEAIRATGIEFEGKDLNKFFDVFKDKVLSDAKLEPNKKIDELKGDNDKLKQNYTNLETEFNQYKLNVEQEKLQFKKDNDLLSFIPDIGLKVSKDIALLALKSKGNIGLDYTEEGKFALQENGQVIKDEKTRDPIEPKGFITEKLKSMGLFEVQTGGKGGTDQTNGSVATDYDKFVKEMEAKGHSEGSEQFNIELNLRQKNKTISV